MTNRSRYVGRVTANQSVVPTPIVLLPNTLPGEGRLHPTDSRVTSPLRLVHLLEQVSSCGQRRLSRGVGPPDGEVRLDSCYELDRAPRHHASVDDEFSRRDGQGEATRARTARVHIQDASVLFDQGLV